MFGNITVQQAVVFIARMLTVTNGKSVQLVVMEDVLVELQRLPQLVYQLVQDVHQHLNVVVNTVHSMWEVIYMEYVDR